ncbi:hypothetical protein HQ447_14390 [bacterium]|nr:hypothetical protein [bacterium]
MKTRFILFLVITSPLGLSAVTIGQIDNFQSGTLQSWARGAAPAPVSQTTGGPAGVGDRFIRITSDGSGSNGKMIVYNNSQWTGDFSGVPSISVDLNNLGTSELTMRLSFRDTGGGGGGGFITSDSITLTPGGGWQNMVFDLSDLVSIGTLVPQAAFMTNVAQMRILHAPAPSTLLGEEVVATLGVDNIAAVPEPTAALLGSLGVLALLRRRR